MPNVLRLLLQIRAPRPEDFPSPVHSTSTVAHLGRLVGIAMGLCFVTGLISHNAQSATGVGLAPWPGWGYRLTQGVHVASGIAAIPLVLAKVFSAYPRLFVRPTLPKPNLDGLPVILERTSIAVLVGAAFFELSTGLFNINQWYPFGFGFIQTHYAVAWVMAGALLVHIAVKLPIIRRHLGRPARVAPVETVAASAERRRFLTGVLGATGVLTLVTVGQTINPLSSLALLSPRQPGPKSPLGVPINRTAAQAKVVDRVGAPGWGDQTWSLTLVGLSGATQVLRLSDLADLPQREVDLPIACVEGWSVGAHWSGVRIADLVALAGGSPEHRVRVTSMEKGSAYSVMMLPPDFARHDDTVLATSLNGQILTPDHGYPARIMAPNRPGVEQTKWVERIEVLLP